MHLIQCLPRVVFHTITPLLKISQFKILLSLNFNIIGPNVSIFKLFPSNTFYFHSISLSLRKLSTTASLNFDNLLKQYQRINKEQSRCSKRLQHSAPHPVLHSHHKNLSLQNVTICVFSVPECFLLLTPTTKLKWLPILQLNALL